MELYLAPLPIPVFIHDYEQPLGLPEHLEDVARRVGDATHPLNSFDDFLTQLEHVIAVTDGRFQDVTSGRPFLAAMDGSALQLIVGQTRARLEIDDLRGVWHSLSSGLVTAKEAGWSDADIGALMVSIVGLMPQVRALEVHMRGRPKAEIALELKRQPVGLAAPPSGGQQNLTWA